MPRSRRAPAEGRLIPPAPTRADFHAHTARSDGLLAADTTGLRPSIVLMTNRTAIFV